MKKSILCKILSVMLILAMAFTLAACAAKPAETTEPAETTAPAGTEKTEEAAAQPADESAAEPVELSILTRYGDDTDVNARVFREAVAAFAAEHPEVTINDMSVTDETQFNNLFKTCMATADIPTIFMTYGGGNLKSYVDSGLVADLMPYLDADSAWKDTFNSTMFSMLTFEGTDGVYGIPYAAYVDSMFINTKLFEEYGVEIPTTIEELEAACEAFMAAGVTPLPVGDKSTFRGGHLFSLLMAKRTGEDLVKKLASGEVSYDCDEVRDVLTTMKDWADKGYFGDSITTLDGEGEVQLFLTGQSPMIYRNASFISRVVNEMEDNSGVVEMNFPYYESYPQYKDMWHGGSSDAFSISASATDAEKAAAVELLKYVTQMQYMQERNELSFGAFVCVLKDLPDLADQPSVTNDLKTNLDSASGMITEPAEYDTVSGLENTTRTAIQAMWAGESVDTTIATIMEAKLLGE